MRIIEQLVERVAALEQTIVSLQKENQLLKDENQQLRNENRLLREQIEQIQQTNARQAAPFRRRENKKVAEDEKKRPGRKPGHPGICRARACR